MPASAPPASPPRASCSWTSASCRCKGNPGRAALSRCLTRGPAGFGVAGPVSSGVLPVVCYGRFHSQSATSEALGVRVQHTRHATSAHDGSPPSLPPATPAPAGHLSTSEPLRRDSKRKHRLVPNHLGPASEGCRMESLGNCSAKGIGRTIEYETIHRAQLGKGSRCLCLL